MGSRRDWSKVRAKLNTTEWYLLGKNLPYTNVAGIVVGNVPTMEGVEVMTRDTRRDENGKRFCTIYLRLREDK